MPKSNNIMKSGYKLSIWLIVAVVVLAIIILIISRYVGNSVSANNNTNLTGMKFVDAPFRNKAYLISSDVLSPEAKNALAGFNLSKDNLPDGSVNITLRAISLGYQDQNYVILPGENLYFVETSMGDDSPPEGEYSFADDHAVIVDMNGYIK